ncbi:ATP-binding cassette domain-containing protein [Cellulomonas cellasea]|uniref:ABC-2 type transport system ATP-binding protein n=1 Tax=Cellulomonas cellasea TaxID=43670 RepID=A0A7W4UGC5_9CELL|nr:ATP-binding cassette domain-containing protein [Cellulomonas cellasea]MBB2923639.1 ABC-2 type transport system ATP-binding protein [Cellulomonas cellasea]
MIRTRGLTKDFPVSRTETVHAVRGIDLDVEPGELVAVLGPNGAGKTTTIRLLTTLIRPTAGTAEVAGHDVVASPEKVRRSIGYVGQGNGAGHQQRVRDELTTQGAIYGLDRRSAARRADELLDALDLAELARRKVADLSGGQRRRLDVALGLVHAPGLLFLDEPSTGLDPHNRANLWEHVARLRAEHAMTIVLTTHYLDEADQMAERVVVVDHGQVIADDTPAALKRDLAGDRVTVRVPDPRDAATVAALVERVPGAREVTVRGTEVAARVADGAAGVPGLVRAAADAGVLLAAAESVAPTLDDVFLALTGRSLRESAAAAAPLTTDGPTSSDVRVAGKDAA